MKYTTPLQRSCSIYMYNEKRYVGGLYTSLFCAIIPTLFPYFLPFWYPYSCYIFKCFLLLVYVIFFGSRCMFEEICHHRAEVSVLTGPCFGISITLPALAEESDPSKHLKSTLFWMDTKPARRLKTILNYY